MPVYEYECPRGHRTDAIATVALRPASVACACGSRAERVISLPVVQTIGTFAASIDDRDVQASVDVDGSYVDPNLCDPVTGQAQRVRSPGHRKELMKKFGLVEKPPSLLRTDVERAKKRKPIYVHN